jgi:tetratricopeptide (TPR) repeat protein
VTTNQDLLAEAVVLRQNGQVEELAGLCRRYPEDAGLNLQCAWAHDKLGLEREAVPYYERALSLGLEDQDLRDALLGLGSTYRALGEYDRALGTLTRGVERFPDDHGMAVFHVMALYNGGRAKEACEKLLTLLLDTTSDQAILGYRDAIEIYAADLDRVWE